MADRGHVAARAAAGPARARRRARSRRQRVRGALTLADAVGLALALGGPPAVALGLPRLFRARDSLAAGLACQAGLVALVLATAWLGGARPAAPSWRSLVFGAALALLFVRVVGPCLMRLSALLGLAGFERGLASTARLPTSYLVIAVLVGGCAEEWLYRAYAFERASELVGSAWLGGALVVTAFGVAHVPMWGVGASLTTLISGAILRAGYAWLRDLAAVVIAHVATDFVGLVAGPRFSASTRARS